IRYIQSSVPIPDSTCSPFHTILVDLTCSENCLFERVKYNTRYKIKRAADRDGLSYDYWASPGREIVAEFCDFYDRFAVLRRRPAISRSRLSVLADSDALDLSV